MLPSRRYAKFSLFVACLFLFAGPFSLAQISNVTDITSTPIPGVGHDYLKMLSETVNPANGSLSIRISVPMPEGRGLALPFSFAYDSNGAYGSLIVSQGIAEIYSNTRLFLSQYGWSYTIPLLSAEALTIPGQSPNTCNAYSDYVFEDPQGTRHALGLATSQQGPYGYCAGYPNYPAGGDDEVRAALPGCPTSEGQSLCNAVAVADADGTAYLYSSPMNEVVGANALVGSQPHFGASLPYTVEDRNGNILTFTDNGGGAFAVKDTLNRAVLSSSGFGSTGNTVTVLGCRHIRLPGPRYPMTLTPGL